MNRRLNPESQAQFVIMLEYMERNIAINKPAPGPQVRRIPSENHQNWQELAELLNTSGGTTKTVQGWRQVWRDFKNNTRKKLSKIKQRGGNLGSFTQTEIRLLKLLKALGVPRRIQYSRKENKFIESKEAEVEPCQGTVSPPPQEPDLCQGMVSPPPQEPDLSQGTVSPPPQEPDPCQETVSPPPQEPDPCQGTVSPPPEYVCAVYESTSHRRKSNSSIKSNSTSSQTSGKRKKPLNDVTDRYFEFEREREALAHEREMARIRQNEKLIDIFGRMVNVLETLTPRIERYLNRNKNKDG